MFEFGRKIDALHTRQLSYEFSANIFIFNFIVIYKFVWIVILICGDKDNWAINKCV